MQYLRECIHRNGDVQVPVAPPEAREFANLTGAIDSLAPPNSYISSHFPAGRPVEFIITNFLLFCVLLHHARPD